MKILMWESEERVERRTGTTRGSPFSPGGQGRMLVGDEFRSLETVDPVAQERRTSTMYWD